MRRNGANRNVHLLTHGLNSDSLSASFVLSVRMGVEEKTKRGSAGFLVGVIDLESRDPRASLLMGKGMAIGVKTNGKLFIGKEESTKALSSLEDLTLRLEARPSKKKGFHQLFLFALEGGTGKELARLSSAMITSEGLTGNMAIGCNIDPQSNAKGGGKLSRFSVFRMESKRRDGESPARSCLRSDLYAMHTLSRGTLALTAQMPPLGEKEANSVRLDAKDGSGSGRSKRSPKSILCPNRDLSSQGMGRFKDVAYRVVFEDRKKDGSAKERYFEGVIRKDPVDKKEVVVAGFTGNKATAFPNSK